MSSRGSTRGVVVLLAAALCLGFVTGANTAQSQRSAATTRPEREEWSADGTAVVAIRVTEGGETLAVHDVVTLGPSGYTVTGIFIDFDEIAALLLRPI